MTISPPGWAKDAIPTARGWESPTGELLKSQRFTNEEMSAYNGDAVVVASAPEMLTEAGVSEKSLGDMTKVELEAMGRTMGVELDRRKSKSDLVQEIEELKEEIEGIAY
jgi:hypothetical protein|tara:strand:- start:2043 stop:2369 length:327 start_codon:yes stop_codon:yes gene_type:complete